MSVLDSIFVIILQLVWRFIVVIICCVIIVRIGFFCFQFEEWIILLFFSFLFSVFSFLWFKLRFHGAIILFEFRGFLDDHSFGLSSALFHSEEFRREHTLVIS